MRKNEKDEKESVKDSLFEIRYLIRFNPTAMLKAINKTDKHIVSDMILIPWIPSATAGTELIQRILLAWEDDSFVPSGNVSSVKFLRNMFFFIIT